MHIIGGKLRNRKILTPKGELTRPTSATLRESLFNICQMYIQDARFLDLFAGSGAMGFEALSRGALLSTFVDNQKESLRCIEKNASFLEVTNEVTLLYGDVFLIVDKLARQGDIYDIIYADPPYHKFSREHSPQPSLSNLLIQKIDHSPLLINEGRFFIEEASHAPKYPFELKTLKLKSSRKMGRSWLQEFIKTQSSDKI
jgi:16S rRNA (guanine966-N2)-methyltransferase